VREVQTASIGEHFDGGGLVLRVTPSSASWILRFTLGRRREMGLGSCNRTSAAAAGKSLTTARERAQAARDVIAAGGDPIEARRAKREAIKQAEANKKAAASVARVTLLRAARHYHERVIEPNRTTKHGKQWIASIEGPPAGDERPQWRAKLDALLALPVASVGGPALLDAITDMQAAVPETASRVRQRLEAIFDDCEFRGMCTGNPARAIRRKLREAVRTRDRGQFAALLYADAPAFMARLRGQTGTAARALEFAVLTAARTGEVLGATWAEVDLVAAVWRVPAERMKGGEEHLVYLPSTAIELLKALPRLSDHLFPSPVDDRKPLSNMAMLTVLRRMRVEHLTTVHGLCRATFSTWAHETAAARPDVIEAALAHQEQDRVRAAYNRAQFAAERRALLQKWADYLDGRTPAQSNAVAESRPAEYV
jgi:integrase